MDPSWSGIGPRAHGFQSMFPTRESACDFVFQMRLRHHRIERKAWDRGALSARSGDASTRPQWLADKLRAAQMSAFSAKSFVDASGRKKASSSRLTREQAATAQKRSVIKIRKLKKAD